MNILVTGAAGFIGFHMVHRLIIAGYNVVGIDNINNYYDVNLKYARLAECGIYAPNELDCTGGKNRIYREIPFSVFIQSANYTNYRFIRLNIEDKNDILNLFENEGFSHIIHLAAQAGVRYSIENPGLYLQSNITGFLNILEACRHYPVKHLIFASSSSVYGNNSSIPFTETANTDKPVSLYAATKKSNELLAYTYSYLYDIKTTGLRFFTVYGPWGRPDMSPIIFADAIVNKKTINMYNNGKMNRDFTYIDDVVTAICKFLDVFPDSSPSYSIYNIGYGSPVSLEKFIELLETKFNAVSAKNYLPLQLGDVLKTWACTDNLKKAIQYQPEINMEQGLEIFVDWYRRFYLS